MIFLFFQIRRIQTKNVGFIPEMMRLILFLRTEFCYQMQKTVWLYLESVARKWSPVFGNLKKTTIAFHVIYNIFQNDIQRISRF